MRRVGLLCRKNRLIIFSDVDCAVDVTWDRAVGAVVRRECPRFLVYDSLACRAPVYFSECGTRHDVVVSERLRRSRDHSMPPFRHILAGWSTLV